MLLIIEWAISTILCSETVHDKEFMKQKQTLGHSHSHCVLAMSES